MSDIKIETLPIKEQQAIFQAEMEYYGEKLLVDAEGKMIFINKKYAWEFGKTPEEMIGKQVNDFFDKDNMPVFLDTEDFGTGYIEGKDEVIPCSYTKKTIFCRSPIVDNEGNTIGHIWYDGRHWLSRYKSLYVKLSEMFRIFENSMQEKEEQEQEKIAGKSLAMAHLKKNILEAAHINSTVLIEGETGTGKELVADAIVCESERKNKPFIKINCAAIPKELFESELFGYESGAFTGALRGGKKGKFAMADGGTILLDEINSLGMEAQAKILRVIQEKTIDPVGGEKSIDVDVRVIAISNKPLEELVKNGEFREDLYYRLNVIHINVPPLREHKEDIKELVKFFVRRFNISMGRHVEYVDSLVYKLLEEYDWPGNIRELQNYIERSMITAWKDVLRPSNFFWMGEAASEGAEKVDSVDLEHKDKEKTLSQILKDVEREVIIGALKDAKGNKSMAAKRLGIARQILYRKMHLLGICEEM